MAKIMALYKTPKDKAAFDAYYFGTHIPLAKTVPGLQYYEVSRGPVRSISGPSGIHLVATLHFPDLATAVRAMASPQGKATAADVANFADGGFDLYVYDDAEV